MSDCKIFLLLFTITIIFLLHHKFSNKKGRKLRDVQSSYYKYPEGLENTEFYYDEVFKHLFLIGDRVIVRRNEPDPLMIGKLVRVELVSKGKCPMPIVQDEKDGKEYLCFSLIKPYDVNLFAKLSEMQSIEQYNYLLARNNCCDNQIKEKYRVKYNTFDNEGEVI